MSFIPDVGVGALGSLVGTGIGVVASTLFRAVNPNDRLSGRWEGDLECKNPDGRLKSHVMRCVIVLARPIARPNSGLLYYQIECTSTDKIIIRGLDELKGYKAIGHSLFPTGITMDFIRRFHKLPSGDIDESERRYRFHCKFDGVFSRAPRLEIITNVERGESSETWFGTFQKH